MQWSDDADKVVVDTEQLPSSGETPHTEIEVAFLDRLMQVFRCLTQGDIPFCVLRNRERIPGSLVTGSDVDLIVPAGTPIHTLAALLADLHPVHMVSHRSTLEVYLSAGGLLLHVDLLISDREWRGARYLENSEILAHAQEDRGMPVAWLPHQAFCAWFSNLTRRKWYKSRYTPLISAAARQWREPLADLLQQAFGRRLGQELMVMAERGEPEQAEALAGRCRRAIFRRAMVKHPLKTLYGLAHHCMTEIGLRLRPTGLSIAVLGPDGAGKSAVCAALAKASRAELPFRAIEIQHLYQRALPRLSELRQGRVRRTPAAPATVHDPHGKRAHWLGVSVLCLLYAAVDQWLSLLWYARSKLAKNYLLVHDRHMLELRVDPKRLRFAGPPWLACCLSRLFPMPDLVILLDAPAEVLQSRKQEVPFEETRRQREAYSDLVAGLAEGHIVRADRPLQEVVADVKRTIVAHLADRTASRFALRRLPDHNCVGGRCGSQPGGQF